MGRRVCTAEEESHHEDHEEHEVTRIKLKRAFARNASTFVISLRVLRGEIYLRCANKSPAALRERRAQHAVMTESVERLIKRVKWIWR